MSGFSVVRRFRWLIARFAASRRGNVAIQFGILLVPLVVFMGAAIDYGRAARARTAMQSALDAAALMVSTDLANNRITSSQITTKAQTYFAGIYTDAEAQGVTISASYTPGTINTPALITLTASGHVQSYFMQIAGFPTLSFGTSTTAASANSKLRVAMVLDLTNSMNQSGKLDALKGAAKTLVDQLTTNVSSGSDDVLISLVPFATSVNVGPENYNASWLSGWTSSPPRDGAYQLDLETGSTRVLTSSGFPAWEDPPRKFKTQMPANWSSLRAGSACPFGYFSPSATDSYSTTTRVLLGARNNQPIQDADYLYPSLVSYPPAVYAYYNFGCQVNSTNGSNAVSTIPPTSLVCPTFDIRNLIYYNGCYTAGSNSWTSNSHSTWNGCVSDRNQPYDTQNTSPTSDDTRFPVLQAYGCPTALKPLSNNWTGIKDQISAMVANGSTNQSIGLAWGWMMLTPTQPFGAGSSLNAPADTDTSVTYNRAVILLSDGLNTMDRWYGDGNNISTQIDARQQILCTNMKNAGITIYTIQVNTTNDPQSSILASCASTPADFFYLTSASQILAAFDTIATRLKTMRITQ